MRAKREEIITPVSTPQYSLSTLLINCTRMEENYVTARVEQVVWKRTEKGTAKRVAASSSANQERGDLKLNKNDLKKSNSFTEIWYIISN